MLAFYQVADAPVAACRDGGDDRIAVEPKERHGRGQHARAFVLALVEQLARGAGHNGVNALLP